MDLSTVTAAPTSAPPIEGTGIFPTSNTDLGAIIGALRIPIRQWEKVREADQSVAIVTHIFAEADESGENTAAAVDWAWRHREEFERTYPDHPINVMRAAIESLRWVVKVYHGQERFTPIALPDGEWFSTTDFNLAAVLRRCGAKVARLNGRAFVFNVLCGNENLTTILAQYADYEPRTTAVAWMRATLEIRATLIEKTKPGGLLRTKVRYVKGDPLRGGKELKLYETPAPGEDPIAFEAMRRQSLELFHQS